ncbi:MAG: methionyl-tRNA formyltransferase [Peptococcaceae bacterium]|jgi:methionyl-tRNA formyltransferase|nr:methionyl-tRNA formyltransferase [Peptococcaceae bacterium]
MRVVYMGSPDFAVKPLEALIAAGHEIAAVITQPDRPRGRGGKVLFTPVKEAALAHNLPILQPARINEPEAVAEIAALAPDILVVVAFGQLLKKPLLALAPFGAVNIHGSLLPYYRGAAPIHWAIINGEKETGVTIMYMDEGMDTGDMIASMQMPLFDNYNVGDVYEKLSEMGAELLLQSLRDMEAGVVKRTPQNHAIATYAPLLKKEHEEIHWEKTAEEVHNHIRGMYPFPTVHTMYQGKRLKIGASVVAEEVTMVGMPGQVLAVEKEKGVLVACGKGSIWLKLVQPEGKKMMAVQDFICGYGIKAGDYLGRA